MLAAIALLGAACSSAPPPPTSTPAAAPAASAAASPSAAVVLPSPSPAVQPSASAVPSPSPLAATSPPPPALSPYPFGVMIDNIQEARPQSGLAAADVVYEVPAEAEIPRMLALYLTDREAERIGPVRSARHYYVYIDAEYGAALVHIGASPQGFDAMTQMGTVRVDEARGDGGFTRDPHRDAPHNAFVSTGSIRAELAGRGTALKGSWGPLRFGAFRPGPQPGEHLRIAYACCVGFTAQYDYDGGSHTYPRTMDGQPHTDEVTGERYAARSVIVQQTNVQLIPGDTAGRLEVDLVGSGTGMLLAEGTQVPLTWSKSSYSTPTQFRREDGQPFSLPEGQAWVEVVPLDATVTAS